MPRRSGMSWVLRAVVYSTVAAGLGAIVKLVLDRNRRRDPHLAVRADPEQPSGPGVAGPTPRSVPPEAERADAPQATSAPHATTTGAGTPSEGSANGHIDLDDVTKQELYERAKELDIHGRSKMNKEELAEAIEEHGEA